MNACALLLRCMFVWTLDKEDRRRAWQRVFPDLKRQSGSGRLESRINLDLHKIHNMEKKTLFRQNQSENRPACYCCPMPLRHLCYHPVAPPRDSQGLKYTDFTDLVGDLTRMYQCSLYVAWLYNFSEMGHGRYKPRALARRFTNPVILRSWLLRRRLRRLVPGLRHDGHSLWESLMYSQMHSCSIPRHV